MSRSPVTLMLCAAAVLALTCAGESTTVPPPHGPAASDSKVDPDVVAELARTGSAAVIVLGTEQLLPPPRTLDDLAREVGDAPRSEVRTASIEALKSLAAEQQARIRSLLTDPGTVTSLWIANAFLARLGEADVNAVSASGDVAYVYSADGLVPTRRRGSGGHVTPDRTPFSPAGLEIPWNLREIGAPRAWDAGVTGAGVTIALIDTGTRYEHSDLRDRMWTNHREVPGNEVDDDGNGYVDDYHGYNFSAGHPDVRPVAGEHGTWVAGIMVGDGTAGTVTGVAPDALLMPLIAGNQATAALALQYAVDHGADVINMSFSRPDLGQLRGFWRLMADHATAAGVTLVSGAGNFRQTTPVPLQLRIPEAIPSVIAVGGVDAEREVLEFSSMGPVGWDDVTLYGDHPFPPGLVKPDVSAFPTPDPILDPVGGYERGTTRRGNSFSGPHVAGVAALILSVNPELHAWQVREILERTATDLGPAGKDNDTGWGLVDAAAAVEAAGAATGSG